MQIESEVSFLSVRDVGELLTLSPRTMHRILSRRELPSAKIGRRRVIRRIDLENWLAGKADRAVREQA